MHASAAANGVVVSFRSKMLTHRKIAPATIKPKLAMSKSLFSIFFISFSPFDFSAFYRTRSKYSRLSRLSIITGHAQAAVTLPPNCCSRPHPPWGSRPCPGSRRRWQGSFSKRTGGWAQFVAKRCLDSLRAAAQAVDHIRGDGNLVQLAPEFCGLFPECVVIVQRSDAGIAGFAVQPAAGNQIFHGIFLTLLA